VATRPLPAALSQTIGAFTGCIAGAAPVTNLEDLLAEAGFVDVVVTVKRESRSFIQDWIPGSGAEDYVASAVIEARRPQVSRSCCGPDCCAKSQA
jgi:hypothetical protein